MMETWQIVLSVILFLAAAGLALLGVRHLRQRGRLFNNGWLYATPRQRAQMSSARKAAYYRQSGTVFCLLAGVFALIALSVLTESDWPYAAEGCLLAVTLFYAIRSTVKINRMPEEG